jgi:hypothetical protein
VGIGFSLCYGLFVLTIVIIILVFWETTWRFVG